MAVSKIGFGGGCHWCTEAVFDALKGVHHVEQGWIASEGEHAAFSEAVVVHFDVDKISQHTLIEIHLLTHASTSNHSMRGKYRSAIYAFDDSQLEQARESLSMLQANFDEELITRVLTFAEFRINTEEFLSYYRKNPEKAFCKRYIEPKLKKLMEEHGGRMKDQGSRIKDQS